MPRSLPTCLVVICLALSGCAGTRFVQYGPGCRVEKVAELPLTIQRNFLLAPVTVNGDDELFVVDTGAEATLLTPDAVSRLGLREDPKHNSVLLGVAGAIRSANVIARKVSVGDIVQRDKSLGVGSIGMFGSTDRPVSGLLGTDLLARYDVEIDGPGRRIAFYDVHDCAGYIPWEGRSVMLPATPTRRGLLFVPVAIDGRPVRALLDTGARASLVTRSVAYALGVDDRMLDADPHRTGQGVGNGGIDFRMHRFATVDVGDIPMHDMPLNVADMRLPGVEMLLGADWISTRRIWISYADGVVFVHAATL